MFPDSWSDDVTNAASTALRIVLILVVAGVIRWVLHRAIARTTNRMGRTISGEGFGSTLAESLSTSSVLRAKARARTIQGMAKSLVTAVVGTIATLTVLSELNINLAPLLAGAGIAGIAIGFGAQSLVKDFVAGFFILVEDQFGVGDSIDVGTASGTVEEISLRSIRIRDVKGTVWHIPNGSIQFVGNQSKGWSRAVVDITVGLHVDIARARQLMVAAAVDMASEEKWQSGMRLGDGPDDQGVAALTPAGATLRMVVTTEPKSQAAVERELRQRIKETFDAEGISLEVPHIAPPVL